MKLTKLEVRRLLRALDAALNDAEASLDALHCETQMRGGKVVSVIPGWLSKEAAWHRREIAAWKRIHQKMAAEEKPR